MDNACYAENPIIDR